jgi:hypothetical protein
MSRKNKHLNNKVEKQTQDFLGFLWTNWVLIGIGFMMFFIWFCICWTVCSIFTM